MPLLQYGVQTCRRDRGPRPLKALKRHPVPNIFATAEEAELAFYDALERADLTRLMQVWADDEEIVCVHPGGLRVVGLHAVKESWQEILANGGLAIRPSSPTVLHSMMGPSILWLNKSLFMARKAQKSPTAMPRTSTTKVQRAGVL